MCLGAREKCRRNTRVLPPPPAKQQHSSARFDDFVKKLADSPITRNIAPHVTLLQKRFGDEYQNLAERILSTTDKLKLDANEAFAAYMYDYLCELYRFQQSGEYGHNNFDDIYNTVLNNKEIMEEMYYPGLFLSYGFTAVLFHKYRLFKNSFLPKLNARSIGVEVGFGEGFYLWEMCNKVPGINPTGFDISPSALNIARSLLDASGYAECKLSIANIIEGLPLDDASQDFGILAEVLEHLPDPDAALREMARVIMPGGYFYLATVKDENHMDHITNFPDVNYVRAIVAKAGFDVLEDMVYGPKDDFPDGNDSAVGMAFVCKRS
jgi:ubiquinone/menaquinone biosynthesis C-methylase UbiE